MSSFRIRGLLSFFFLSLREKKLVVVAVAEIFSACTMVPTGVTPPETGVCVVGIELPMLVDDNAIGVFTVDAIGFFAAAEDCGAKRMNADAETLNKYILQLYYISPSPPSHLNPFLNPETNFE